MRRLGMLLMILFFSLCEGREMAPVNLIFGLLPPNPVILEAGANDGTDTQWMSELWPNGTIHCFEPYPEIYEQLKMVAEKRPNIRTYPLALTDRSGKASFYLSGGASSLLKHAEPFNRDYFHADLNHPIEVECITIDQWAQNSDLSSIDFMWLDMEGNELHALKGALGILPKVKLIYAEVNLQRFWEDCASYMTLKSWLEDHGFEEIWSEITPHWHGNVLFKRVAKSSSIPLEADPSYLKDSLD